MLQMNMKIKINSIIFGCVMCANMLAGFVNLFIPINNLFVFVIFLGGVISFTLYGNIFFKNKFKVWLIFFILIFLSQFLISIFSGEYPISTYYLQCFVFIGMTCLFIGSRPLNFKVVRKTVQVIALLSIVYYFNIITLESTIYNSELQMGMSYSILPVIFVNYWSLFNSEDEKKWKVLACVQLFIGIYALTNVMTRGAWLCLFIFIFINILNLDINSKKKIILIYLFPIIIFTGLIIIRKYFISSELFYALFIEKQGDMLNGRTNLFNNSFSYRGIFSLLFGSGIGAFFTKYDSYPHNLFGQLFYDQGLIVILLISIPIIQSVKYIYTNFKYKSEIAYMLLILSCISLIKLQFSSEFWIDQSFWLLIGQSIYIKTNKKEQV